MLTVSSRGNRVANHRPLRMRPITNHVTDQIPKFIQAARLLEVSIYPKPIRLINISVLGGTTQHDFRNPPVLLMALKPRQNVKPGQARHLQIQDNELRKRVFRTIGEAALASEILD